MKKNQKRRSSQEPVAPPEKSNNELFNLLLIIVLSAIPYLPSLYGDFVFDDAESIVNNPIVNGEDSLSEIFNRDFWGKPIRWAHSHKSYRPITTFTFWINYKLHGTSTFGYHLVNVLLHSVVSVVLYLLVKTTENVMSSHLDVALPAALLFAVHPIHTEAIANITGRAELLMALFALLAIQYYLTSMEHPNHSFNIFTFALFVTFSTFSKEQGIMSIPVCLVAEFLAGSCSTRFRTRSAQLIFLFLAIGLCRFYANGFQTANFTKLDNPAAFIDSRFYKAVNYIYIWLYHAYLMVVPAHLCFDYSMGCISTISTWKDLRVLSPVLLFLAATIGIKFGVKNRLALFSMLFGIISFLPSSNIFFVVGFTVAERVLYLPSVGFCILCGILYKQVLAKNKSAEIFGLMVLILSISKGFKRSEEWNTELKLYSTGLQVCPANAKIHYNLAKVLGDSGYVKDAERNYWNAIKLNPSYEQALNNLGNLLEKEGDSKTAEGLLARAIVLRPNFAVAWMNLGITQMNLGKYEDSEKSLRNSLRLRSNSAHCLFNLGVLYQKQNQELLAMSAWINATRIDPKHTQSWTNLFVVLDKLNMCSEVIRLASSAIENVPYESSVLMQIGSCYAQSYDFEKAENFIKQAIDMKPASSLYRTNLGVLYQRMQRLNESADQYRLALILDSKNTIAASNLPKVENHHRLNNNRRRNMTLFH